MAAALLVGAAAFAAACEQSIEIGDRLLPDRGASPPSFAGMPSDGGGTPGTLPNPQESSAGAASGGATAGGGGVASSGVVWSTSVESGDLSDFTNGGPTLGGTDTRLLTLDTSQEQAHSGETSIKLSFDTADGQYHAADLYRHAHSGPAYYSAWFFISQRSAPAVYWTIFHFFSQEPDEPTTRHSLWDLNLNSSTVYFYDELARGFVDTLPNKPYPVGAWFQLEAYLDYRADGTGRLLVWQDGEQVLGISNLSVAPNADIYWGVGSATEHLEPSACTVYIDDLAISLERVGP